ncbi:MAG: hypothetical protein WKF71_07255 [Pyrinomonadaceae bacterium]
MKQKPPKSALFLRSSKFRKSFELELEGMFFSKDLSKTIVYSVAPPGTSQHLSMLAFDASEHENPEVREILARYGWLQTVVSDLPHFTYLGVAENELSGLGLKKLMMEGAPFGCLIYKFDLKRINYCASVV